MLYNLRRKAKQRYFDFFTRAIFDTPPMKMRSGPITLVSMLRSDDVQMYLISIKSFYSRLGKGQVIVIADRDLTVSDRQIVQEHMPCVQFVGIADIDVGRCQRGGTWERLLFALDHARDSYVVQLDSDVLAFGNIDEIVDCATENRAFVLGSGSACLSSMTDAAAVASRQTDSHIVTVAHCAFKEFPGGERLRYALGGSSGLSGYARGGIGRDRIEEFHGTMQERLGERWHEWGSEQVASNFAVANAPKATILPWPKYSNHWPGIDFSNAECLHFLGTHRFRGNLFINKSRQVITELNSKDKMRRYE